MRQLEMTTDPDLILGANPGTSINLFHIMEESHFASVGFNCFICENKFCGVFYVRRNYI